MKTSRIYYYYYYEKLMNLVGGFDVGVSEANLHWLSLAFRQCRCLHRSCQIISLMLSPRSEGYGGLPAL